MSNRVYSKQQLDEALATLGVTDHTSIDRYGSGHINDTFKVETASGRRYILQRITDFFPADVLKRNILRITNHLKNKGVSTLDVVAYENPWRLYGFLEGYTSSDIVTSVEQAEFVARAYAKFQNDLVDLPEPSLEIVLPRFHDTPDRIRLLDEAAAADVAGRKELVRK